MTYRYSWLKETSSGRLEVLHHDHSDHPDSHTSARDFTLGPIQIRPSAYAFYLSFISDPGWFNNVLKEYISFRITIQALGLICIGTSV